MKEEKTSVKIRETSSSLTPFEQADANATSFVGSFMFLEKFSEMVEQYQALNLVMEELEAEWDTDGLQEVYLTSKRVLEEEKKRMEESFVQASMAWTQKFGYDA